MRQFRRIPDSQGTGWAGPAIRTVVLIGDFSDMSDLATYLPLGWHIAFRDRCDALGCDPDVVVLAGGSAADVRDACARLGDVPVVCTISPDAPASEAIAVLQAGADACVRSQGPLVLSAHIRACQRRRQPRPALTLGTISALSGTVSVS
jgi:hypothetical protein